MKKIQLPYEQVLEVIGIDTGPFQVSYKTMQSKNRNENKGLQFLLNSLRKPKIDKMDKMPSID